MNKLTEIIFGPRPTTRRAALARPVEAHIPNLRREPLISVWTRDPTTNCLVCTWRRPAVEGDRSTGDIAEPPQSLRLAA